MESGTRRRRIVIALIIVAVLTVFVGLPLFRSLRNRGEQTQADPPVPVTIFEVTRGLAERTVRYPANLSPETTTPVIPKVGGRITSLLVSENETVQAGTVIATIEDDVLRLQVRQAEASLRAAEAQYRQALDGARDTELEIARAELSQAETGIATARSNLERTERLFQAGTVSRAEFEDAENQFNAAETEVENARRRLELMEEGATDQQLELARANAEAAQRQLELAELQLSFAAVTAPLSGTVARVLVEPGQSVGQSTTLVALVNDRLIFATAAVPERLYGRFLGREGSLEARVRATAYEGEPPFVGTVSTVARIIDSGSRTFEVEVAIPNDDGRLRPGMFVNVEFVLDSIPDAVLVPDVAVHERAGTTLVFTESDGNATAREVTVAELDGPFKQVLGGLEPGERVIAEGGAFLESGAAVRVVGQ